MLKIPILFFEQLRPNQWTKNLLIFAAFIFSIQNMKLVDFLNVTFGFFLFSFVAGCVYILNDFVDREVDKQHPEKCNRPMASGKLKPHLAFTFGFALLFSSLYFSYFLNPLFFVVLVIYFLLNIAYSFKLKHVVIIDVLIIASGFVFRAISGALVIHVPFTPWFLLCAMLLALFLAIGKRRHELISLSNSNHLKRKVLGNYSLPLLDQMSNIVTTGTLLTYCLFTFDSGNTIHLMWTIPFVIYGIFRYLYLIHVENKGGKPEQILLQDKHILFTVVLYTISVILILIIFE